MLCPCHGTPTVSDSPRRRLAYNCAQVARRRLKRPPRRSAHLATHRARVSLAQAGIDRVAAKVDEDVAVMREQVERDERDHHPEPPEMDDDDGDTEVEGESTGTAPLGRKVAG